MAAKQEDGAAMTPTRVLFVGDLRGTNEAIGCLNARGYEVDREDGANAWDRSAPGGRYVAVVLSAGQGQASLAMAYCERARAQRDHGLVVLYSGSDASLGIQLLEAGADDVLRAPANPRELVARIGAIARRQRLSTRATSDLHWCSLRLDPYRGSISDRTGRSVVLSALQFDLLRALAKRGGEVVPREVLITEVLGDEADVFDRAVDVQICRLRKRLAALDAADLVTCVRGAGYRLQPQSTGWSESKP